MTASWRRHHHRLGTSGGTDDGVAARAGAVGAAAASLAHQENVHFYGTHSVDIDGELAQLDADGYRPLRLPGAARAPGDTAG
jgi:hypothetical protein